MPQNLFRFLALFIIVLVSSYFIHTWILELFSLPGNISILTLSYTFNSVYTILLVSTIVTLKKRLKDQLGFVFLAGSFLKIGVFLAILKLTDLEIDKSVFLDFFIPYMISLSLEVYYVSKILNNLK
ncbi:DUF6168 family protein [Aquimarina sp. RZ0]|uniref:DUF6168 family protein n=1 Tax=Aquimarina sp. RZ0 TaxID=2607730 RepID=UPI0011F3D61E|nr:DUF6168 family protein [Aquimarina sp. RZ0]KAA1244347.1 hypothetical protein F0000_17105 [Aquimarina sp. RZ0]